MITQDTEYNDGDLVSMVNDPDTNVGIVSGYKIMPGADLEYLVVWSQTLSSWCYGFELELAAKPEKKLF